MTKENLLEWTSETDDEVVLMRATSTDNMFYFEIESHCNGECDGECVISYHSLLAEGTLLSERDTVLECQVKAQKIQNAIDGTDE